MSPLLRALFPRESRYLPGQRWMNVLLRSLHLIGIAGIGAGYLYAAADETWRLYEAVCILSGFGLAILFLCSNGIWLLQLRGLVVLAKLLLLYGISLWPHLSEPLLLAILALSGWISHAPARVRYYSVFHGRRIESLE